MSERLTELRKRLASGHGLTFDEGCELIDLQQAEIDRLQAIVDANATAELIAVGDLHVSVGEPDEGELAERAMVVVFDDEESLRQAVKLRRCTFRMFGEAAEKAREA